ncbi:MAG TPA: hypothetical protein VFD43_13940, partial [Planctomycetota bacterium]|nr:hypothetical protein [Planctomycetota bacterium]
MPRPTSEACLALGAALALLVSALPDSVLLPAVDRWPPRQVGLAITGMLVSAGWLAATWGQRPGLVARRGLLLLGLAAAGGCFLSAGLATSWRAELAAALRDPGSPYYALVALACLTAAAPAALPLGALAGIA